MSIRGMDCSPLDDRSMLKNLEFDADPLECINSSLAENKVD